MQNIDKNIKVLVTGGTGYLASWIIKLLLDKGIKVHATVRNPSDTQKFEHLTKIDKTDLITFYKADLLNSGSFEEAMQGCDYIIHTASPFFLSGFKDAQKELIEPAKLGTRNVLETAKKVESIKRVVLTSSVVAVYGDAVDVNQTKADIFTEDHWNTTSNLEHQPYSFSKTVAEKEAWTIAKTQTNWDLVVINPGWIMGPSLSHRNDSFSIKTMIEFGNGTYRTGVPDMQFGGVDVRDVAKAHVNAMLLPQAKGRHILVNKTGSMIEIANIIRKNINGKYPLPTMTVPKSIFWLIAPFVGYTRKYVKLNVGIPFKFDNSYSKTNLEMTYRPYDETITDHFKQILDDGLI